MDTQLNTTYSRLVWPAAGAQERHSKAPEEKWARAMRYLPSARERTQVVHAWLNQLLIERMSLEPSALAANDTSMRSRVTAYLSDAMLAFEQCKCAPLKPCLFY